MPNPPVIGDSSDKTVPAVEGTNLASGVGVLGIGKVGVVGADSAPTRDFSKDFFSVGIQGLGAFGVAGEGTVAGVVGSGVGNGNGVIGTGIGNGIGVKGTSVGGAGIGVSADSGSNDALQATTNGLDKSAVFASNNGRGDAPSGPDTPPGGNGVFGLTFVRGGAGVFGSNNSGGPKGRGVQGNGPEAGVGGFSDTGVGVLGEAAADAGVVGFHGDPRLQEIQLPNVNKVGVFGASQDGPGVMGYASRPGADVFGVAAFGGLLASAVTNPLAGKFEGNVQVNGDIFLPGADCAEHFDVADGDALEPGTVMVINNNGILEQSAQAYDKRVAGVISGAGNYKTGIVLDKQPSEDNRKPIALIGKVNCKVDAHYSPIELGDLLTTSPTPGHAMKASEPQKAFGSVIGKALRELREGQGLIPILIALQ